MRMGLQDINAKDIELAVMSTWMSWDAEAVWGKCTAHRTSVCEASIWIVFLLTKYYFRDWACESYSGPSIGENSCLG